MAYNETKVLKLLKYRLDILQTNTSRDEYLTLRIKAAAENFDEWGITLSETSEADAMLLADYTAWAHNNRDEHLAAKGVNRGEMPRWLQLRTVGRAIRQKDDAQ